MIKIQKQLTVFLDNRPGVLASTCKAMAKAEVNITALSILDTIDYVVCRMVVDNPKGAEKVLADMHELIQERDVVVMDLPNEAGALAKISERLAQAGVNIEYAYCTTPASQEAGSLVLRTNDLEETISILG